MPDVPKDPIRIFIASSSHGLGIAENLKCVLDETLRSSCAVRVWKEAFDVKTGKYFMNILEDVSVNYDFAIIVLTPDHAIIKNGKQVNAAGSNVVLEAGLFIASWGLERVLPVRIKGDNLDISDLLGIQVPFLNWKGSYELPPNEAERDVYDTRMQRTLRRDVAPRVKEMLCKVGKRGLGSPLDRIVRATRNLETLYRHGKTVDTIYLDHAGKHMQNFYDEHLQPAQRGEITLIDPEEESLPDILAAATKSVKAVAHFKNIQWWYYNRMAKTYLAIHDTLSETVAIERVFILPVMSLKDNYVQYAIEQSCIRNVKVQLLLWQTADMETTITLQDKVHNTHDISHHLRRIKYKLPPESLRTKSIKDDLSFLIVDDQIVSYSNIPVRERDTPSQLFVTREGMNQPVVESFIRAFDMFSRFAIPAERLFPEFYK